MEQCASLFVAAISLFKVLVFHPDLLACLVLLDGGFIHCSGTITITTCSIQISQLQVDIFALSMISQSASQAHKSKLWIHLTLLSATALLKIS
jgi:type 1 fimbria pilin